MATETKRIQLRRDTAANWTTNNPVMGAGEFGFETDTSKFKIGNGVTAWASLSYIIVDDLGSVAPGKGASTVGVEDSGGNYTGTDVEAVLAEISTSLGLKTDASELAATTLNDGAALVGVHDAAANFTGTDVEAVLAELQTNVDGKAASSHNHAASDVTSGTFADARVAESNVTQHQAALTITESQISDLAHVTVSDTAYGAGWNGDTADAASKNAIYDKIEALDTAKADASHTHATADVTSGTFADARIAESNVTQHEAALSVTESQISDLGTYVDQGVHTTVTAGFDSDAEDLGTISTGTTTPEVDSNTEENFKFYTNGGAHTLAAPSTSSNCVIHLQVTNNGSAGAITFSGFSVTDGDTLTTTNGDDFFITIVKNNGFTSATVKALQ